MFTVLRTYYFSRFAGVKSRDDAASLLANSPDGGFIVRESEREKGKFVLSVV